MTHSELNDVLGAVVVAAWASMLVAPRARWTRWLLHSDIIPLGLGFIYAVLVLPRAAEALPAFASLEGVVGLFKDPHVVFAGWVHYLAFDLLVGRVILADSQTRGLPHLAVAPVLLTTFMFGPLGYLLYAVLRVVFKRVRGPVAALPSSPAVTA